MQVLITAKVRTQPEHQQTEQGAEYSTAALEIDTATGLVWGRAYAYGQEASRLLRLRPGDRVGISGSARLAATTDADGPHPMVHIDVAEIALLPSVVRLLEAAASYRPAVH